MNMIPENFTSSEASDECRQVLDYLMFDWPEEPGDDESPAFHRHLCQCRDCLRTWIALEVAADLASVSFRSDVFLSPDPEFRDDDSRLSEPSECAPPRP